MKSKPSPCAYCGSIGHTSRMCDLPDEYGVRPMKKRKPAKPRRKPK